MPIKNVNVDNDMRNMNRKKFYVILNTTLLHIFDTQYPDKNGVLLTDIANKMEEMYKQGDPEVSRMEETYSALLAPDGVDNYTRSGLSAKPWSIWDWPDRLKKNIMHTRDFVVEKIKGRLHVIRNPEEKS